MNDNLTSTPTPQTNGYTNPVFEGHLPSLDPTSTSSAQVQAVTRDMDARVERIPEPSVMAYPVNIEPLSRGFIVKVGCQTFAFETAESMLAKVSMYVRDIPGTQKLWFDGKLFS